MAKRDLEAMFPGGDRFELIGELGRGGMGVVYEVRDRERGERLALKGLRRVGPRSILRLKHEFRAVADLQHPNLVRLHELFEHDGAWFFTMELVDGVDFLRWVRPGDPRRARRVAMKAAMDGTTEGSAASRSETLATVADGIAARVAPAAVTETLDERRGAAPRGAGPRRAAAGVAAGAVGAGWDPDDEPRLRAALRGLVGGVAALHRAGMVHRDIKPSNLLVEAGGRVVLLDFGVVADVTGWSADTPSGTREVVGTVAYMAPEQAAGDDIGPATDWYAVGTVLFEALTGELPFAGSEGIEAKITVDPPSPRQRAAGVPDDLVELCERLLRRDPGERPGDAELLAWFGIQTEDTGPVFIGRAAELDALGAAFEAVVDGGEARAVIVAGESGIGKSALARRFLDEVAAVRTDVLVLTGRCDERELVSYNAFDGAVDALARCLAALPRDDVAAPGGTRELLQIFPVLRGVAALEAAARRDPVAWHDAAAADLDPRSLAFAALADLLTATAARRPVVLLLDDVHWADADSLALLGELFAGADAPGVLLVATARVAAGGAIAARDAVRVPLEVLALGGLSRAEAELLVRAAAPGADAARLASEAGGHPMFLAELARHSGDSGLHAPRLDDALWQRIGELDADARALLEVVALGAAALPLGVAPAAAGLGPEAFARSLAALRDARLVRSFASLVEPYHDRVRETLDARLPSGRRRTVHQAIATSLEAAGAGVEVLAYHLAQAGDGARAAAMAESAARRALDALAFDRAAEWLRVTLELGELAPDRRRALYAQRAEVLARAGRSAEAADAFLAAAEGEPVEAARELRRRAAEQLLTGGHLERGRALAGALAAEIDLSLPVSTAGAIARLLWYQGRLRFSRLRWPRRPPETVTPRDRMRIDVAWSVATGLSMVDSTRGACIAMRLPLLAMPSGDPARIARAICAAAVAAAGMGRRRLAERLRDAAHRAAADSDDPSAGAYAAFADVAFLFYFANDWRGAVAACERAAALLPDRRSHTFEGDVIEQHHLWSLQILGEIKELRRRVPAAIRSAQRTGNRFVEVSHRTFFTLLHLVADRPAEALEDLRDALAGWSTGGDDITNPFFFSLKGRTTTALYQRDPDGDPTLDADWARVRASLLYQIPLIKVEITQFLGQLEVGRASLARARGDAAACARHLAGARRWIARTRIGLPASTVMADLLEASVALVAGDVDDASRRFASLIDGLDAIGQRATAAACRWRLAALVGGSTGDELRAAADRCFADEGVRRPDRLVDGFLPGWV